MQHCPCEACIHELGREAKLLGFPVVQQSPVLLCFGEKVDSGGAALGNKHEGARVELVVDIAAETEAVSGIASNKGAFQLRVAVVDAHLVASELRELY